MVAANTTHGRYGMAGAAQRVEQRFVRTLLVRSRLLGTATRLERYLAPVMAARLARDPAELRAPKRPSQVAFEAAMTPTPL